MPRSARVAPAGYVYHVLNRGVGRMTLLDEPGDYAGFERVLAEALERHPHIELLAYGLMPNHWHLVLRATPGSDAGELGRFMQWLTLTHTRRWQEHRHCHGSGPVYQGRYKSFPVQDDTHFLTLCLYVERNPLRLERVRSLLIDTDMPVGRIALDCGYATHQRLTDAFS